MKQKVLNKLSREILGPVMFRLGFEAERGRYIRELPSKVIHLFGHGLDPHCNETFRMMSGLNSTLLTDKPRTRMGLIGGQHVTPEGWSCASGSWPCADEEEARNSLLQIREFVPTLVEPWFQEHVTLSSIAEVEEKRFAVNRAKLYLADGDVENARTVLIEQLEVLKSPPAWMLPEKIEKEKLEIQRMLRDIP